jgi:hypothetical protein
LIERNGFLVPLLSGSHLAKSGQGSVVSGECGQRALVAGARGREIPDLEVGISQLCVMPCQVFAGAIGLTGGPDRPLHRLDRGFRVTTDEMKRAEAAMRVSHPHRSEELGVCGLGALVVAHLEGGVTEDTMGRESTRIEVERLLRLVARLSEAVLGQVDRGQVGHRRGSRGIVGQ